MYLRTTKPLTRGFKNNFVSANQDYIRLDSQIQGVTTLSDLDFETEFTINDFNKIQSILSIGKITTEDGIAMFTNTSNTLVVDVYQGGSLVERKTVAIALGHNKVAWNNLEFRLNDLLVFTFLDHNISNITSSVNLPTIGRLSYVNLYLTDHEFYYFNLQGEKFNLNEKSGTSVYGSNGTKGTRFTSHADGLSYINSEMIERLPVFKNVLTASNSDYLEFYLEETQTSNSTTIIEFEVLNNGTIGLTSSNGGLNYLEVNSNDLVYDDGVNGGQTLFVGLLTIGKHRLKIRYSGTNNYFSLNGGSEVLSTQTQPLKIFRIGRKLVTYYDLEVYNLRFNNRWIPLDEKSGYAFFDKNGALGLRYTSNGSGLSYINSTMIEKL